jgi:murein L,D-transpeptidase YafK
MTLWNQGKVLHTYQVALSTVAVGTKERNGDHKVPEAIIELTIRIGRASFTWPSPFSCPNAADRARAKKLGVDPGGEIEIHGLAKAYASMGSMHRKCHWTNGWIGVTNAEIEEIYPLVAVGTKVEIKP